MKSVRRTTARLAAGLAFLLVIPLMPTAASAVAPVVATGRPPSSVVGTVGSVVEPVEPDVNEVVLGEEAAADVVEDGPAPFAAELPETSGESEDAAADTSSGVRSLDPSSEPPAPDESLLTASATSSGFALLGVTWDAGSSAPGTEVEVRTRTGDVWSGWQEVEVETEDASAGAEETADDVRELRDGTDPWVVGRVDEIQVALRAPDGAMPTGARLVVIDPGETVSRPAPMGAAEVAQTAFAAGADVEPRAAASVVGRETSSAVLFSPQAQELAAAAVGAQPQVYSRAQWGADESLVQNPPVVGQVKGAVVHHTAGNNGYAAADVPAILRGIYSYHVLSRGWPDIGYNFLVDRFGRIWEGRAGGIDRAIVGAHAAGVNSQTFGISVMGNYDVTGASAESMNAVAQLLAWKLALHGVRPNATFVLNGVVRPTVLGHRDVGQTACPGRYIYPRLAELRQSATAWQGELKDRSLSRDLNGVAGSDLLLRTPQGISIATAGSAGFGASRVVSSGWSGARTIAPGDWNADGVPDLMVKDAAGILWLRAGTSAGGFGSPTRIGNGWNGLDLVVGGGHDWDGDGRPDLLARGAGDGSLWLYPSNGSGGFGAARRIGNGWSSFGLLTMIGNLNDGRPALVARGPDGVLYAYIGDGRGGFAGSPVRMGAGWGAMTALVGTGDITGDGTGDLVARDSSGRLWRYPGTGLGGVTDGTQIGNGWSGFTAILSAGKKSGGQDLLAFTTDGKLMVYPYAAPSAFGSVVATGVPATAGTVEAIAPGDWNGDGRADLILRQSNGDLVLHAGQGGARYASSGTRIGNGWAGMTQVIGAGDWLGTGKPGLIALHRPSGRIWLYPGDGRGGFGTPLLLAENVGATDRIVNAGRWSGGAVPDLLTRNAANGELLLRRGNGGGTLDFPTRIGLGWSSLSSVVGAGDLDGDGAPDLVATASDGTIILYPGNGQGGFRGSKTLGTAPKGAVVS